MHLKNSSTYLYRMLLRPKLPAVACWILLLYCISTGCSTSRIRRDANQPFRLKQLQRDYTIFREILEESHPSVSWYTPADSMKYYFDWGYHQLRDSMTEPQFRSILTFVISKIHCGHTSTRYSKRYIHYLDTAHLPIFPVSIKVLEKDSVILNNTLRQKDYTINKGTILTKFDGQPFPTVLDSMGLYIPNDGYNTTYLRQALSNRGAFGAWLRLVKGWKPSYSLSYLDDSGTEQTRDFRLLAPFKRDTVKRPILPELRETFNRRKQREERLMEARSLQVDTGLRTAYLTLNTFNNGNELHSFFKSSFQEFKKLNIQHLIIDIRGNGGGNVNHSTYLTRLLVNQPFKIADSLYALNKRNHRYGEFIQYNGITGIFMSFITRRRADGKYHFGFYERHYFKPARRNHFDGKVYVLTGPNSFSAASIFARSVKGQANITLIGEETGGGNYGNTAWFIPNVTLPETGVRFRLPKFRLVMNKDTEKNGRGVMPDIYVQPTREAVIQNRDLKVEKVRDLILAQEN